MDIDGPYGLSCGATHKLSIQQPSERMNYIPHYTYTTEGLWDDYKWKTDVYEWALRSLHSQCDCSIVTGTQAVFGKLHTSPEAL
jgi:hypothetical protein